MYIQCHACFIGGTPFSYLCICCTSATYTGKYDIHYFSCFVPQANHTHTCVLCWSNLESILVIRNVCNSNSKHMEITSENVQYPHSFDWVIATWWFFTNYESVNSLYRCSSFPNLSISLSLMERVCDYYTVRSLALETRKKFFAGLVRGVALPSPLSPRPFERLLSWHVFLQMLNADHGAFCNGFSAARAPPTSVHAHVHAQPPSMHVHRTHCSENCTVWSKPDQLAQKHKPVLYMYMCLLWAQLWISFHFHEGNNSNDRERSMHLLRIFCCVTLNVCSCAHSVEIEPVRVLRGRERRNSKDEDFSVLI